MKRFGILLLVLMLSLSAASVVLAEKGPIVDTIFFDVRMQEDIGLKDTVAGKTDVFLQGLNGPQVWSLSEQDLSKLDIYKVPSGSWSLLLNPYPNEAPYTGMVEGKEQFNPFAIQDIRFALNYLINRQYIVDEILGGAGGAMFTPATPGQPGVYKYNLIASKLGMTPEGDEEKAIADITAAMEKAAALPELKGRLVKDGQWWTFDGEPIVLKFALRADDPNGRVKQGMYVANQVEKAGIKVDRGVIAREKCYKLAYYGDPANLEWHLYTEGWGAGATRRYWGVSIVQMYASVWGYLPGGGTSDFWNFKNEKIDELAVKAYNGEVLTEEEYWNGLLTATELGMKDAVRIQVCYQEDFFVANKSRFNQRMAYGLGDGLNQWSIITADTKGGILRVTQYSDRGSLFMSAWDPVGVDGFSDVYSGNIVDPLNSRVTFESPVSAISTPEKVIIKDVVCKVTKDADGNVVGEIPVDPKAVKYDPIKDKWVEVGEGLTSFTKGVYGFKWAKYHHGVMMDMVDFLYGEAFEEEWKSEDYPGDPTYDEQYSNYMKSYTSHVATVYDFENKEFINYYNYNFPADEKRLASWGAPTWKVTASGQGVGCTWEVVEALSRMVAYGSESGTAYSFSGSKQGTVEVDVLVPNHVADIKAELEKMIEEKHVPVSIKDYITVEDAIARYEATLDFINRYGHAYISDGPFMLEKYDNVVNYAKLTAFRDDSYPFEAGYWNEYFKTTTLKIEEIDVPAMIAAGEDFTVTANVSQIIYPSDEANPAKGGKIEITLIAGNNEYKFEGSMVNPGVFEGTVSGDVTADLEAGSYTILVIASQEDAVPSSASGMTIIY